ELREVLGVLRVRRVQGNGDLTLPHRPGLSGPCALRLGPAASRRRRHGGDVPMRGKPRGAGAPPWRGLGRPRPRRGPGGGAAARAGWGGGGGAAGPRGRGGGGGGAGRGGGGGGGRGLGGGGQWGLGGGGCRGGGGGVGFAPGGWRGGGRCRRLGSPSHDRRR